MNSFECFVVEEVIRSGNSHIHGDAVLDESWPCEDCPCWRACSKEL